MPDEPAVELSPGARKLLEQGEAQRARWHHDHLGLHHHLLALLEHYSGMAAMLAADLDANRYRRELEARLQAGDIGESVDPEQLLEEIASYVRQQGKARAFERDVAVVLLRRAGWMLASPGGGARSAQSGETSGAQLPEGKGYRPRAREATPALDRFGRDLCREAQEGKFTPLIGRERELQAVIETLCRRSKRNPVLVGPAGVGKTAIVEGLAQRVVSGQVPPPLQGIRIIALQPSSLVAGGEHVGEIEERMEGILAEARQEGIVLFVDELHSLVGAGGMMGTQDLASLFKPALARGDLACIGATTDNEHRRFIEPDTALERRFQPIRVAELDRKATLQVLQSLRPVLEQLRGVRVADEPLGHIIELAGRFLPNRYFPDKAVDILEQCVATAVTQGAQSVDTAMVDEVVQRMVSVPLDWEQRLAALPERLRHTVGLEEDSLEALVNRLHVTMRGIDLHPQRPNVTVLVAAETVPPDDRLACALSLHLFGSEERLISVDLSSYVHPADVSRLVGAAPGYVGYSETVPLHALIQRPWSVVLLSNVDRCHPAVRELLAQCLREGVITDGQGRRIFLSDAVVVLTATVPGLAGRRRLGFLQPGREEEPEHETWREAVRDRVGDELAAAVDVVAPFRPLPVEDLQDWLRAEVLEPLSRSFSAYQLEVAWDDSVVHWLLSQREQCSTRDDWERLAEENLAAPLARLLDLNRKPSQTQRRRLQVKWSNGEVQLIPHSD